MCADKRAALRVKPGNGESIEVQVMGDSFLDIFEARDISATGLGIFVPYRFEGCDLNNPVDLVITLPNRRPFLAKGTVVHRTKTEREFFGISFCELAELHRQEVEMYVDRRLREEGQQSPQPV